MNNQSPSQKSNESKLLSIFPELIQYAGKLVAIRLKRCSTKEAVSKVIMFFQKLKI